MARNIDGVDNAAFTISQEGIANNASNNPNMEQIQLRQRINTIEIETGGSTKDVDKLDTKKSLLSKILFWIVFHSVVIVYFSFATKYYFDNGKPITWCDGYGLLIIIVAISYFLGFYFVILKRFGGPMILRLFLKPIYLLYKSLASARLIRFSFCATVLLVLVIFLIIDTQDNRERLISAGGIIVLLIIGYVFSKHRKHVKWRPVFMGLALQFIFGLLTIRWPTGQKIFQCIGDKVTAFLGMTNAGSSFIYGDFLTAGFKNETYDINIPASFAFSVLPVVYFMSFMVQILYFYGIMQAIVAKIGWLLKGVMGTTVCESVNSAANIFLGMTEAPLLLKPYLNNLTKSEIHSVMTGGFATVSGTVLAAYISFGANPGHLITASIMSAPAALCFSKLFYPETEESQSTIENLQLEESNDTSVLDAASRGASNATEIIVGIIANVVAFVAFIAFLNAIVSWLGNQVGFVDDHEITFEWILGQIFRPLSWIMGVRWEECEYVGTLIGLKTAVNEFAAYQRLGEYKKQNLLSVRGEAIATYAICGFSNPGSIGIMIGGLSTLIPKDRSTIVEVSIRAFISGAIVCFMTACIAGMLIS